MYLATTTATIFVLKAAHSLGRESRPQLCQCQASNRVHFVANSFQTGCHPLYLTKDPKFPLLLLSLPCPASPPPGWIFLLVETSRLLPCQLTSCTARTRRLSDLAKPGFVPPENPKRASSSSGPGRIRREAWRRALCRGLQLTHQRPRPNTHTKAATQPAPPQYEDDLVVAYRDQAETYKVPCQRE